MGTHYCHLKPEERRKLAKRLEAKMPVSEIADRLGREPPSSPQKQTNTSHPEHWPQASRSRQAVITPRISSGPSFTTHWQNMVLTVQNWHESCAAKAALSQRKALRSMQCESGSKRCRRFWPIFNRTPHRTKEMATTFYLGTIPLDL